MQIVIDIPEEVYEGIMDGTENTWDALDLILKSKILPKGHGRLIDADALDDNCDWCHTDDDGSWCYKCKDIDSAPTIIDAE